MRRAISCTSSRIQVHSIFFWKVLQVTERRGTAAGTDGASLRDHITRPQPDEKDGSQKTTNTHSSLRIHRYPLPRPDAEECNSEHWAGADREIDAIQRVSISLCQGRAGQDTIRLLRDFDDRLFTTIPSRSLENEDERLRRGWMSRRGPDGQRGCGNKTRGNTHIVVTSESKP